MIELMTAFTTLENFSNSNSNYNTNSNIQLELNQDILSYYMNKVEPTWIIAVLIIASGASYLAFECNIHEKPATRAVYSILAFFFSGFYLIYYFIVHIFLGYQCFDGKNISNIIKEKKNKY